MEKPTIIIIRNAAASDFGGAERLPVFIAQGLNKVGYRTLVVSRSSKMLSFARDNGVTERKGWWWSRQNWSGWRALLTPVYLTWQLILVFWYLQLFIRLRPIAVHLQSKDDFVAGTISAWICGAQVVWSDYADLKHVWKNIGKWYKNPTGRLVYWCARLASHITVVSRSEQYLVTRNLSGESKIRQKITVVHIGVFDQDTSPADRTEGNVIFCSASRIVTDKGIRELLAAFTKLRKTNNHVELWILGDGPEMKELHVIQPGIKFYGHVSNPLAHIKAADVFVLPTHHEGFSVALVEASMLGKAIIATRVGGNVEIIDDNKTGLLVNIRDSEDLMNAMAKLANNASLRDKLGDNARRQYEQKFTFDIMLKNGLIPLYEKNNH